jgi:hypothetical protein
MIVVFAVRRRVGEAQSETADGERPRLTVT